MTFVRASVSLVVLGLAVAVGCGGSSESLPDDDAGGGGNDSSTGTDGNTASRDGATMNDGTSPVDSSMMSTGVPCGQGDAAASCDPTTQVCCVTFGMGGGSAQCIAKGATCQGASVGCSSAANCASGDVCCGAFTNNMLSSACQAAPCPAVAPLGRPIQLCATDGECPNGEKCRTGFGGIKACAAAGGFDGGIPFDASFFGG
jgi:Cys-rich repeat protein